MSKKLNRISKSQYKRGLSCEKSLWLYRKLPNLLEKLESDDTDTSFIEEGFKVGEMAKLYYKGSHEITEEYYEVDQAIKSTKKAIKDGRTTIYEATAMSKDGLYARIDILKKVKGKNEWDLIEVKATTSLYTGKAETSVKEDYLIDLSAQLHAFESSGYKIRKTILMYLNKEYTRKAKLDIKELFTLTDITAEVRDYGKDTKANLDELLKVLKKRKTPEVEIDSGCFNCEYKVHCWPDLPDYTVFSLFSRSKKKLENVRELGILDINDIPKDFEMTELQAKDVSAHKKNKVYKDKKALKAWSDTISYPIYYLDYETTSFAIPEFKNTNPYLRLPFQFSLHIQKKKDGPLEHIEFLHTEASDPREAFVKKLILSCKKRGSIMVYYKGFEESVNKELAIAFPKYKKKLLALNDRIVDLYEPFAKRLIYSPKQNGSTSIKKVLPSFCPTLSYDDLDINNGALASQLGKSFLSKDLKNKNKIARDLLKYCELDTYGMAKLYESLKIGFC